MNNMENIKDTHFLNSNKFTVIGASLIIILIIITSFLMVKL